VEPDNNLMPSIIENQPSDPFAVDVSATLVDRPLIDGTDTATEDSQWNVVVGVLAYKGRIYIPASDSVGGKVICQFHDFPESGHCEALKTTELVSRDIHWPVMDSRVCKYVSSCKVYHRIEAPQLARHAIDMSLETPSQPWDGITMDFVSDLRE
jgi:hypothetical protein